MAAKDFINARDIEAIIEDDMTCFEFHVDASDLEWPPGHVPEFLKTNMGNGQNFVLVSMIEDKFIYEQIAGRLKLTVYND